MELSGLPWRKASRSSGNGGNCVEVVQAPNESVVAPHKQGLGPAVLVRDSKDPQGPVLSFTESEWEHFIEAIKAGEFDSL